MRILAGIQPCSVRAICYRLFTLGLIPDMSKDSTNAVGRVLVETRERREIPFEWIVDETRQGEQRPTWDDPQEFGDFVTGLYAKNKWQDQPTRVEVWSEKSTVRGTLRPVTRAFAVKFTSVHGFTSATSVQDLVLERLRDARPLVILYVGDWDPSGLHMSEVDLPGRAEEYTRAEWEAQNIGREPYDEEAFGPRPRYSDATDVARLDVRRIALSAADIADSDLPSFAAATKGPKADGRKGDPRHDWFVHHHGQRCWELDAMNPNVLRDRVRAAIQAEIDQPIWDRYTAAEEIEKASIVKGIEAWNDLLEPLAWADPTS
jgi:hypothetical protein